MFLFLPPLTFFGLPLFCFSFPVSLLLLSFFPSCFSSLVLFLFLVFVFFIVFLLCFCFMNRTTWKYKIAISWFSMNVFFFCFLSCFLFEFFLSFFFPDFELCLLFNIIVFGFKKPKFKNTNFWTKGGLQHNGFFYQAVFCKMWKVIVFGGGGLANFWLFFKNTIKIGILAHFSKQKLQKNDIFKCYCLVQVKCYYLVQVGCVLKKRQLGPDNNI